MKIRDGTLPPPLPHLRPGVSSLRRSGTSTSFTSSPPQSTLRSINATSVAKCKQLTCLCASLLTTRGHLETSPTAKTKVYCSDAKKKRGVQSSVQSAGGREEGSETERVHLCLRKISPSKAKQVLFLIVPTSHWKSGYTSLEEKETTT